MVDQLARAIFGISDNASNGGDLELLALTDGIPPELAEGWRSAAPLEPRSPNGVLNSETVGIFATPERDFVAARAHQNDGHRVYAYTHIPRDVMRDLRGNIYTLFDKLPDDDTTLPNPTTLIRAAQHNWSLSDRVKALDKLLTIFETAFTQVLALLNAAIRSERLLIINHHGKTAEQVALVQGMMAMLPASVRADLTFSTHTPDMIDTVPTRVIFGDASRTTRHIIDWQQKMDSLQDVPWTPYIELLAGFWQGDVRKFLEAIDTLDALADCLPAQQDTIGLLTALTSRFMFNARVHADEAAISPADLKEALADAENFPVAWRRHYADMLLNYALETKDTEADSIIAHEMDVDPELDADLQTRMNKMLDSTPDLVYVFMRQRLSEGMNPRWLRRLHEAAQHSLDLAFESDDPDLILSWLHLIAREPDHFELQEILHDSLMTASPYARQDGEFGLSLLILAARFASDVLDKLLDDEQIIEILPTPYDRAFTHYERDALAELQAQSTSLFLAGMKRAAENQVGSAFEAGVIERLWAIADSDRKYNRNADFQPEDILRICAETGTDWLPSSAIETLLKSVLTNRDEVLFPAFTHHLSERGLLGVHLSGALIRGSSNVGQALDTVSMLVAADKLLPSDALAVYATLLEAWGWSEETQPIMESSARLLMHNSDLILPINTLRRMLETAAQLHDEASARAAAIHLLDELQTEEDAVFTEAVQEVFSLLAWSTTARDALLQWWRKFVQQQPTARLTRLDNGLDSSRVMEDALSILRSVAAMRRLVGKRDATEFAQDVNTAYEVLETLVEAFGVKERDKGNGISFEPQTIREMMNEIVTDLSPHQRQILSNSLKAIANLIARMGDNRSKAGLGRSADSLDRQFMTGEQKPQGSVDAMKWIAGYLAGSQAVDDES